MGGTKLHYMVKERREELGMSQTQLIEKSGVSRSKIYQLENGFEGEIKVGTLLALMKTLKCGVHKIIID